MPDVSARIAKNLSLVRHRIEAAAIRSGRRTEDIKLVAVTKYVGKAEIEALVAAGCTDLGESRPQQLWQRAEEFSHLPIRWHMIGHLQRNKVRRTLPLATMIHSADSLKIIKAINESAAELASHGDCPNFRANENGTVPLPQPFQRPGDSTDYCVSINGTVPFQRRVPLLLEVNTSGEPAKGGFQTHEVEPLLPELAAFEHVDIRGLMCMASLEGGQEAARRDFAALRNLRDRMLAHCPPEIVLQELSMGMSGDYEIAIEEGATIVRIGSALFEGAL
jgi:PLP dependent protein